MNIPTITKNLLIINVLAFLATIVAESYGIDLAWYLGLHYFRAEDFNVAQLITYMFMHSGFTHIFLNMFALWMFGRILEHVWGPKRFLSYYMICGIGAGLVSMLVSYIRMRSVETGMSAEMIDTVYREGAQVLRQGMNYSQPPMASLNLLLNGITVGASGAIYGILLGFGMLFPNQPLFIFPLPFPIKAKYFVIGYAVIELYAGFANNPNDNTAHFAHLGGMIFGYILIMYWKNKNRNNGHYYN